MTGYLTTLCFVTLFAAVPDVSSVEQRAVPTTQHHYSAPEAEWRKGLFYGLEDVLYSIRLSNQHLYVHALKEGKIDQTWDVDFSDVPDRFRMTAVTSDSRDTLYVLFSGTEELLVRLSLKDAGDSSKRTFSVHGFAQEICYIPDWDAIVVVGQNSSVLLQDDGTANPFGPENFYGSSCCPFTTAAVSKGTVALNADLGLRLYTKDQEQIIWQQSQSELGFIREIASAGKAWVAIESGIASESSAIRVFLRQNGRFVSYLIPLPEVDNSLGMTDGAWRITDYGYQAIVWSRRSGELFRVLGNLVGEFFLEDDTIRGRVCPGHSENIFLIDPDGYTVISFN